MEPGNKKRMWHKANKDLPEGNSFCYVPLRMQNLITLTVCHQAQLKKAKIYQIYARKRYYPITVWGILDANSILTTPNQSVLPIASVLCLSRLKQTYNPLSSWALTPKKKKGQSLFYLTWLCTLNKCLVL